MFLFILNLKTKTPSMFRLWRQNLIKCKIPSKFMLRPLTFQPETLRDLITWNSQNESKFRNNQPTQTQNSDNSIIQTPNSGTLQINSNTIEQFKKLISGMKTTVTRLESHCVLINCPLVESFVISVERTSCEVKFARFDKFLKMRKVFSHRNMKGKMFCVTDAFELDQSSDYNGFPGSLYRPSHENHENKNPDDKEADGTDQGPEPIEEEEEASPQTPYVDPQQLEELGLLRSTCRFLTFYDPQSSPRIMDNFLTSINFRPQSVFLSRVPRNPSRVIRFFYFELDSNFKFVCILRKSTTSNPQGQKEKSKIVEVVNLKTGNLVFQEGSVPGREVTHVDIIRVARTGEVQLFVGAAQRESGGPTLASWRIYRVVKHIDVNGK